MSINICFFFNSIITYLRWGVAANASICGKVVEAAGFSYTIMDCVTMESFWTWEPLTGINIDVVLLVVNCFIFWSLLVLIEARYLKKGE